jgi:acetyl-CoA C-acetyltransferase
MALCVGFVKGEAMSKDAVVVVGLARTPIGAFQGALSSLSAAELGAFAIRGALERANVLPDDVDEVIMGNVLSAGQGQAPARQAALRAGLPTATGCLTINKMCGSGMKAVMLARDQIQAGSARIMVAGGMESMSRAPYLVPKARAGFRLGHGELKDHLFLDGLEDAFDRGQLMGMFAEQCAQYYGFDRASQDAFALTSLERSMAAMKSGAFNAEIEAVTGEHPLECDETPLRVQPERIASLKPAFRPGGTVTAANASSISDGAAALVLMKQSEAASRGIQPLARIVAHTTHAQIPALFTTAPIGALRKIMATTGWGVRDIDLFEINEAFAVVTLAAMRDLDLPHEKVNVHGGACALGHPIGASGARILATLISALHLRGARRGVASLCIGGGEATAVAVERI